MPHCYITGQVGHLDHDALVKELPKIAVGLEDPRALCALYALLELLNDALKKRR
jgi:hypothetical protein